MSGIRGERPGSTDSQSTSDDDGVWVEVYPDTNEIKTPLLVRSAATRVPGRSYKHFESREAALEAARREEAKRRSER